MGKRQSVPLRLLIITGLAASATLIIILIIVGHLGIALSVCGVASLLWWLTRQSPPEGEVACGSVSCCHYLGESAKEPSSQQ